MRSFTLVMSGLLLAATASDLLAHGGGLNAEGCHFNRKTGDYHCHRAPAVAALRQAPELHSARPAGTQPASPQRAAPTVGRPTCYVGPRGGTYTITVNGRKNYGGC